MLVKLKLLGGMWHNTSQVLQNYIPRGHLYVLCRLFQCIRLCTPRREFASGQWWHDLWL